MNHLNKLIAVFAKNNKMYFQYGESIIEINDDCNVLHKELTKEQREFRFYKKGELLFSNKYIVDLSLYGIQPFDYIEEEDFDWGLLMSNLINDKERREVFTEVNSANG